MPRSNGADDSRERKAEGGHAGAGFVRWSAKHRDTDVQVDERGG